MGKASRRKGSVYENKLAKQFRDIGFKDAKRHLEFQGQEAEEGRDLDGTQPLAIQAKCWKSTPSIEAINQIVPSDEYPIRVAILKRTQSKGRPGLEVAVLDLDTFLDYFNFPTTSGKQLGGTAQFYYASVSNNVAIPYRDNDKTSKLHISLVNRSATAKNAGATGEIVVKIAVRPIRGI